jgi:hypothetical protein
LSELYEILVDPKYNIGLKKGVIPIFIAITLHAIKQYIVIYRNNRELELNSQLLLNINEKPHEYTVSFERWDDSKAQYINRLEDIFRDYIIIEEKEANSFSYIIKAINENGDCLLLEVYCASSGPAIGGLNDSNSHLAAQELAMYICQSSAADYDYEGYYLDTMSKVHHSIQNGVPYWEETEISTKEFENFTEEIISL